MSNIDIFRQVLVNEGGLPRHIADGYIANFIWESGGQTDINTGNTTGDGGTSWGAAQWHGPRRTQLLDFATQQGTDWTDPYTQARFALWEMNNTEAAAHRRVMAATDATQATQLVMNHYERPNAEYANLNGRLTALGHATGGGAPMAYAGTRNTTGAAQAADRMATGGGSGNYTIQSGDTLSRIAQRNGTTVAALMAANPQIRDQDVIRAGERLTIPGIQGPGDSAPLPRPHPFRDFRENVAEARDRAGGGTLLREFRLARDSGLSVRDAIAAVLNGPNAVQGAQEYAPGAPSMPAMPSTPAPSSPSAPTSGSSSSSRPYATGSGAAGIGGKAAPTGSPEMRTGTRPATGFGTPPKALTPPPLPTPAPTPPPDFQAMNLQQLINWQRENPDAAVGNPAYMQAFSDRKMENEARSTMNQPGMGMRRAEPAAPASFADLDPGPEPMVGKPSVPFQQPNKQSNPPIVRPAEMKYRVEDQQMAARNDAEREANEARRERAINQLAVSGPDASHSAGPKVVAQRAAFEEFDPGPEPAPVKKTAVVATPTKTTTVVKKAPEEPYPPAKTAATASSNKSKK